MGDKTSDPNHLCCVNAPERLHSDCRFSTCVEVNLQNISRKEDCKYWRAEERYLEELGPGVLDRKFTGNPQIHFELNKVLSFDQIDHIAKLVGSLEHAKTDAEFNEIIVSLKEYVATVKLEKGIIYQHANADYIEDYAALHKLISDRFSTNEKIIIYKLISNIFILEAYKFFDSLATESLAEQGYSPETALASVKNKLSFYVDHINLFDIKSWIKVS